MSPNRLLEVPVTLTMTRFSTFGEGPASVECMACGAPLDLHQPHVEIPYRLLGICEKCQHWYVLELAPGEDESVMVRLPVQGAFRDIRAS
jgi:hypothetical protein